MRNEYQLSLTAEEIEQKLNVSDVKPDWDQNDSSAPNYIENRICYATGNTNFVVDTPEADTVYKLTGFANSRDALYFDRKNILKRPGKRLEGTSFPLTQYIIHFGYTVQYSSTGKFSTSEHTVTESLITDIGGTNYMIDLRYAVFYIVQDVTSLNDEFVTLFDGNGIYVKRYTDSSLTVVQGSLKMRLVGKTIKDWFIPDSIARTSDVFTKQEVIDLIKQITIRTNESGEVELVYP